MYRKIIISVFVCLALLLVSNCGRRKNVGEHLMSCRFLFEQWTDTLSNDPAYVCAQVDSLLVHVKDSVVYYQALVLKSKAKMFMSEIDSAECLLDAISRFCSSHGDSGEKVWMLSADAANMKGNLYVRRAVYDSARDAFSNAYRLCEKAGGYDKLFDISLNLADSYVVEGEYDRGAFWYRKALRLADSLDLGDEYRFPVYYGLAQVNMNLRDFGRCDYFFDLAGKYYDRMKPYEKHIYLNNRGNSYYYREDYPSALAYFRRLLAFLSQYPEMKFERNLTMVNMGEVFLLMNETDSATYYLDRCYPYFREIGNTTALYYIDTQLIELALKKNNLALARKRLRDAVKPDFVDPNMLHIRNRYLQHYFEESGNFRQAYLYLKENNRIDDSIRNERVKMRTAMIALEYRQDSTLMEKEMLIQQNKNKVLRLNQWLYGGALVVLLAVMFGVFAFLYRKKKRLEKERNLQMSINSLRLANIRNRISPHFIFNVLNREMHLQRESEGDRYMKRLVKLIRRNLELADSLSVSLRDELDFVRTYIDLESVTLQPDFVYTFDVDACIDTANVQIPSMLVQIPVENAIKHGLRGKPGRKRLCIRIVKEDESIMIAIRDNGGGFRNADSVMASSNGTGTGMKVITRTLQLLNAYNRFPIEMRIANIEIEHEAGCEVYFKIPIDYSFELKK